MVRYGETDLHGGVVVGEWCSDADLHGGVVVGVALSGQQELTARQQKQQQ